MAVSLLTREEKGDLLEAIISYHLEEREIKLAGRPEKSFLVMKDSFDELKVRAERRRQASKTNGKKGGRPKGSKNKEKEKIPRENVMSPGSLSDGRDIPKEWGALRDIWNRYEELPQYKQGLMSLKNPGPYIKTMREYSYQEMEKAIQNYVALLDCQEYPYQGFPGFIEKGLARFFDGAKPYQVFQKQNAAPKGISATRPFVEDIPEEELVTDDWLKENGGLRGILKKNIQNTE